MNPSKWLGLVMQVMQIAVLVENMPQFRRKRRQGERKRELVKSMIGAGAGVVRRFATDDLDPGVVNYYDDLIEASVDVAKWGGLIKAKDAERLEAGKRLGELERAAAKEKQPDKFDPASIIPKDYPDEEEAA